MPRSTHSVALYLIETSLLSNCCIPTGKICAQYEYTEFCCVLGSIRAQYSPCVVLMNNARSEGLICYYTSILRTLINSVLRKYFC